MSDEMGYQIKLYVGTAGIQATQQVYDATDIEANLDNDYGDTTRRGDSSAPPKETKNVTCQKAAPTWKMVDDPENAELIDILAAAEEAEPIALLIVDGAGNIKFDGDVYIPREFAAPLKDSAVYSFKAQPTRAAGRDWVCSGTI